MSNGTCPSSLVICHWLIPWSLVGHWWVVGHSKRGIGYTAKLVAFRRRIGYAMLLITAASRTPIEECAHDPRRMRTVPRLQIHRLLRGLPGRLLLPRRCDALHPSERLHRLRGVRARVPGGGDF